MSENFGAIVSIDFGNSKKDTDSLVVALHNAAAAIFQIDNAIKGFTSTSKTLSSSIKNVSDEFKGILDVNGKYLKTLERNSIVNSKVIADNNSIANTLRSVKTELSSASKSASSYDSNTSKMEKTIRAVSVENANLALNVAGNVVGAYTKANSAVKNYDLSTSKISKTIKAASADSANLGLNIAGNVVGAYTNASSAAKSYNVINSRVGQTIRGVAQESRQLGITVAGDVVGSFKRAAAEAYNKKQATEQLIGTYKKLNVNILTNVDAFNRLKKAGMIATIFRSAKTAAADFFESLRFGHSLIRTISFAIVEMGRRFLSWSFNVHKIASDFLGFRNAIQVATGSLEEANGQMQYAISVARKYKIDVAETARAYSKFINAVTLANMPLQEANKQFAVLAQVGRVLNISTTNMRGLFLAIEQMASKGFVSLEELRRQLGEHLPGAVSIAARAWGKYIKQSITVGEFMKMVEKRTVETTKFLKPFIEELDKMTRPLLEQSLQKSSAAFTDLGSSIELLGANIGTTLQPAFTALANSINFLVKAFASIWPAADHLKTILESQIKAFETADAGTGRYSDTIDRLKSQLNTLKGPMEDVSKSTETLTEKSLGLGVGLLGITTAVGGTMSIAKLFGGSVLKYIITPLKAAGSAVLKFGKLLRVFNPYTLAITAILGVISVFPYAMRKLASSMYGTEEALDSATNKTKALKEELRSTAESANIAAVAFDDYVYVINAMQNIGHATKSFNKMTSQKTGSEELIKDLEERKQKFIELKQQAEITYEGGGDAVLKYAAAIKSINIQIDDQTRKINGIGEKIEWLKTKYNGLGMTKEELDDVKKMSKKFAELNEKIASFGDTSNVAAIKFWAFKKGIKLSNSESKGFYDALINRGSMLDDIKLADKISKKIDGLKTKIKEGGKATEYAAAKALVLAENIDKSKPISNALVKELLHIAKALDNEKLITEMDKKMKDFAKTSKDVNWHIKEAAANAYLLTNNIKIGEDRIGKKASLFVEASKAKDEEKAIKKLTEKLDDLNKKTREYVNDAIEAKTQTWLLKNGFEAGADAVGKLTEKVIKAAKTADAKKMLDDFSESITNLNTNFGSLNQEQNFAAAKSLLLAHNIDLSDDAIKKVSSSLSGLNLDLSSFYRGTTEAAVSAEILRRKIDLNSDGAGKMAREYLKLANVIDDKQKFLSAAERTAKSIEGAFADFLFDPFDKGVKGMVQAMSDALRRMAAEMLANQIMKMVTGFISGVSGGSAGTGGGGGLTDMLMSIGSAFMSGGAGGAPTPMATGGNVYAGNPYWVGDTGTKELFVPNQHGEIIPKRKIDKQENGDSGYTYVVNMNITGVTNPRDFLASEAQLTGRLVEAIKARTRRK